MATYSSMRLVPSHNSHSEQLGIEDKDNMYTPVSSETYGYVFYKDEYGFPQYQTFYVDLEIDDIIPEGMVINNIVAYVKARQTNVTSTMFLYADDSVVGRSNGTVPSSTNVVSFQLSSPQLMVNKKLKFRINYTLQNRNVNGDLFIYGAEVYINYYAKDTYVKVNNLWRKAKNCYKKVNGVWVKKMGNVLFDENEHYEKGE